MKWTNIKDLLPPLNTPVLCVIKNNCGCDHYSQVVFARIEHESDAGDFAWSDGQGEILYHPNDILYWQWLPPMVEGFEEGYNAHAHN